MMKEKVPPMDFIFKRKPKESFLQSLDSSLADVMDQWGRRVARNPYVFIAVPLALTAFLATGLTYMERYDGRQVDLYLSVNPRYKEELDVMESLFPMNESADVDFGRLTRLDSYARIIITADDGGDMLREECFKSIIDVDKVVNNISVVHQGRLFRYPDLCLKSKRRCFVNPILSIVRKMKDVRAKKFRLKYPLTLQLRAGKIYFFGLSLGGVELDHEDSVLSAKAIHLVYFLKSERADNKVISRLWDDEFVRVLETTKFNNVSVAFFSHKALAQDMQRSFLTLLPLLMVSGAAMFALYALCCCAADWVRCKLLVGLAGLISSSMALLSAFGIGGHLGIPFVGACGSIVLVILGVSLLDTLTVVAAWRLTPSEADVETRLGATCRHHGGWVLLCGLATTAACLLGSLVPTFPVVVLLSRYAGPAVFLTVAYHFTFVLGCLAVSGRLEQNKRHHLTCQPAHLKSGSQGLCFRLFCTGGSESEKDSSYEFWAMETCRRFLERATTKTTWKLAIMAIFSAYLGLGCFGLSRLDEGLDRRALTGFGSPLERFFELELKYFRKYPIRVQIVVNHTLEYWKPEVQVEVDNLLKSFENLPHVMDSSLTESWLRLYLSFLHHRVSENMMDGYNLSTKEDFYRGLREVFFRLPLVSGLRRDVVWNADGTEIVASRFLVHTHDLLTSREERELLARLRGLADSLPYPTTVYNLFFDVFEMHAAVSRIPLLSTASLGAALVLAILIMTGDIKVTTISILSLYAIQTGTVGLSALWGVNMDPISATAFSTYIVLALKMTTLVPYLHVKFQDEQLSQALQIAGSSILLFAGTMILSSVSLFCSSTALFLNQQKVMFLYILLGAFQGLLVNPIILNGLTSSHKRSLSISTVSDTFKSLP